MIKRAHMVIGKEFEPDLGLAVVRRLVDPELVGPKLEADGWQLFFDGFEADRVAIEGDDCLILMRGDLHGDIDAAYRRPATADAAYCLCFDCR